MNITKEFFFGIPISGFTLADLKLFITSLKQNSVPKILYGFSLHSIYSISKVPEIIKLGNQADLIVIDGRPFYWLLKMFKVPVKSNISIPESVLYTLKLANDNKYSVLLFGSTFEVNTIACENIKREYPGIHVLNGMSGYFNQNEVEEKIKIINTQNPDIVLIGISSPQKERIAFNFKNNFNAKLIIPCGGMIDVLAGKAKLSPPLIKKLGLASFYRIIQEPKRLMFDRIKFYIFFFFNLLPILIWNGAIRKRKDFSLLEHYDK
jgi:N-acetylglucosaminyldiphosphoundecaprenol N-acetyl-beta-D-mannosaminyltransferase